MNPKLAKLTAFEILKEKQAGRLASEVSITFLFELAQQGAQANSAELPSGSLSTLRTRPSPNNGGDLAQVDDSVFHQGKGK